MGFFKKNKKKFFLVYLPLFFILVGGYSIKYHLPKVVELILRVTVGPKISSDKITFVKFGEIEVENVVIKEKKEVLVKSPKVKIFYTKESLKNLRLKEILVYDPDVYLVRKDSDVNIVSAFSSGKKDKKAGTNVPIDLIKVLPGRLDYKDITYSRAIEKKLTNVNGYVAFNKVTGIDLKFNGENKEEKYQYEFNNKVEDVDMTIKLKNIKVDSTLLQYGFDDKELSYASGIFNMNLNIRSSGLYGEGDLQNGEVIYDSLEEKVKEINGSLVFLKDIIKINFDYKLAEIPGKFDLDYSKKDGVKINLNLKNLPYEIANKYKLLKELNLPLNGLEFSEVGIGLYHNKNTGFLATVKYNSKPYKKYGFDFKNLNGNLQYKDKKLKLSAENIEIKLPCLDYEKKLSYLAKLDMTQDDTLGIEFYSNYLDINGEYNKKKGDLKLYQNNKPVLLMNTKEKELTKINIKTKDLIEDYYLKIDAFEKNRKIIFENIGILDRDQKNIVKLNGQYDKNKDLYFFKVKANNLTQKDLLKKFNVGIRMNFSGEILGEKGKILGKANIDELSVKNNDSELSIKGKIDFDKNKDTLGKFDGEINKLVVKNMLFNGIKLKMNYKDKNLLFEDIKNQNFFLKGNIDFNKNESNLEYKIRKLYSENLNKNNKVRIELEKVNGKITGPLDNICVENRIEDASIKILNDEKINLTGEIDLKDSKVYSKNFKINSSILNFDYSLREKNGSFSFNLLEENLGRYYNLPTLKYRILSQIKGDIKDNKIKSIIEGKIDKVSISGKKLPNLKFNSTFLLNDVKNELSIDELDILNLDWKKILVSQGKIDLKNKIINYEIKKQKIYMKDIKGIVDTNLIKGSFDIEGAIKNSFEKIKYNLKLGTINIDIKKFRFRKGCLNIEGTKERVDLKKFIIFYENNKLEGKGSYEFSSKKYNASIFSKNINLSFLNPFIPEKYVSNISGIGDIDIKLSDIEKENRGFINLRNVGLKSDLALINLKNGNLNLKIDKEKLEILNLNGLVNSGQIKGKGYLKLPYLEEIKINDEFYKDLEYSFNFSMKDVIYEMKNYFRLNLSSNIQYKDNELLGNVTINNGEITGILKNNEGLVIKLLRLLMTKLKSIVGESKSLGETFEIKSKISETPNIKMSLLIRDGININIPDVSGVVQDIQGKLTGRFDILGKDDKITVIGQSEIENGKFVLGNEDFVVNRALILSDKRNGVLANFNPNVIFDISSMTRNGRVEMNLHGPLNNLRLNVSTNKGNQSSSLKNLFSGSEDGKEKNEAIAILFKTLIDSQISNTLLNPISKTIKNIFHISKFRIVSDILNQDMLTNSNDPREKDPTLFNFGAYLEAENPIYKDKYFWVLKVGLVDGNRYNIENINKTTRQESYSNTMNELDFKVERRYKSGWSYGVGVSKLNEETVMEEDNKRNLNYYIDFKFEKKYNSIGDVFKIKF